VDHIIPVVKGGTNDPENLVSACEPCNQGKHAKLIEERIPAERNLESEGEKVSALRKMALAAMTLKKERDELRQDVVDYWTEKSGKDSVSSDVVDRLMILLNLHKTEKVFEWINIAFQKLPAWKADISRMRYIYGIRKNQKEMEGGE